VAKWKFDDVKAAFQRKISLSIFFAQFLLNCELSSRTDLFGWSQRTQAKYFFVSEACFCLLHV
jgi:hypothetical protein